MKTAMVRVVLDNNEYDFVGIFAYSDLRSLYLSIDEVCDPRECEVLSFKDGNGILFDKKTEIDNEGYKYDEPTNAHFNEMLFMRYDSGKWQKPNFPLFEEIYSRQ